MKHRSNTIFARLSAAGVSAQHPGRKTGLQDSSAASSLRPPVHTPAAGLALDRPLTTHKVPDTHAPGMVSASRQRGLRFLNETAGHAAPARF